MLKTCSLPFASLLALALSACIQRPTIQTRIAQPGEPPPGISVSGQGEAKAPPDIARANLGVEVRAATVEQATSEANARMAAVTRALEQAGIASKDLRTHGYSVYFEQEPIHPPVPMPAPAPTRGKEKAAPEANAAQPLAPEQGSVRGHYRVSNMLEVIVRDMNAIGRVLKSATDAGANNVWGVSLEIEDQQALLAKARAQAIERAKHNAAELARLAGVKLGKLLSISESGSYGQPMMAKAMRAEVSQDVPIETGEITVTQQVQLVYAVE